MEQSHPCFSEIYFSLLLLLLLLAHLVSRLALTVIYQHASALFLQLMHLCGFLNPLWLITGKPSFTLTPLSFVQCHLQIFLLPVRRCVSKKRLFFHVECGVSIRVVSFGYRLQTRLSCERIGGFFTAGVWAPAQKAAVPKADTVFLYAESRKLVGCSQVPTWGPTIWSPKTEAKLFLIVYALKTKVK